MAEYTAETIWNRGEQDFLSGLYSRRHLLRFDGGIEVPGSSSPHVVPLPYSDPAAIDPEEAFIAALSSCHMLWFLSIAARSRFVVDSYKDAATGIMAKNAEGRIAMTQVTLHPAVQFSGEHLPSRDEILDMHEQAHEACFIANSVKTELLCRPVIN